MTSIPSFFLASSLLIFSPKLSYKGCGTNSAGLSFANCFRSASTFSLIVINASTGFKKNLVKATSPGLFSCGKILSAIQITFVCLFFFTLRRIVPRHGPMNGNQYLTTIISGFIVFNSLPTVIQLTGFTELIFTLIGIFSGGGSVEYWVVPGNKNDGY